MKESLKAVAVFGCAALCAMACAGCGGGAGSSSRLGKPKESVSLTHEQLTDAKFTSYIQSVDGFSSKFAAEAVKANQNNNFAVSPVSAYMALALCAECAADETREEILKALGTDYNQLTANFPNLFNALNIEDGYEGQTLAMLRLTNSVWINDGAAVKNDCVKSLSDNFYAYSYRAPFSAANAEANKAVRNFIKEQTKGLINVDFKLSAETVFTLVNTLYLKALWNMYGDELRFSDETYNFVNGDGSVKKQKLLLGNYETGRVREFDGFKSFHAETYRGYSIKFIVPDDGKTAREVFTAENIRAVNSVEFYDNAIDKEHMLQYNTRCIFPEFNTSSDCDIKGILSEKFGVQKLFSPADCNMSSFTDEAAYCTQIRHVTKLKVDKKGVEGVAVTMPVFAGVAPPQYKDVYENFIIDKAFGFVLSDGNGVQLFAGIVDKI